MAISGVNQRVWPAPGLAYPQARSYAQSLAVANPASAPLVVQTVPAPAAPTQTSFFRHMIRSAEEGIADVIVALSNVPLFAKIGYWLYGAATKPHSDTPVVPNEGQVAQNLLRGGQVTEKGFETLKSQGVQTVINLRPEETWEEPEVKGLGMKYIYFPLPAVGAPSIREGLQFLSMTTDPAKGKIYFHCQHGADRTGVMAAAYRIAMNGWTADQAIAEMSQYGFHTGFENAKLTFVRQFAAYWASLPPAARDQVLHRSAPGAPPVTLPPFPDEVGGGAPTGTLPPAPPLQFTTGNSVKFLVADGDTYDAAIKLIDSAKQSIQFETFTFNGQHGLGVAQALIRARQRGVNVQVVLDPKAMLISDQKKLADLMVQNGIDVRLYYETHLNDPIVAFDHAKDLVVDGQTALVGGSNFDRRIKYDFNYQVQGPAVPQIASQFAQSWQNSRALTGVLVNKPGLLPVAPIPQPVGTPVSGGDTAVAITETAPKTPTGKLNPTPSDQTYLDTLAAINSATKSVDVLMFTLDDSRQIAALKAAAARGVRVRVLLNPGQPGKILGKTFNMAAIEDLQNSGIQVRWFRLPPGYDILHAKVAIFDSKLLLGGTMNWVHSGDQDCHEVSEWFQGPVAGQAQATFDSDWQNQSDPVTPPTFFQKIEGSIMNLLSGII